MDLAYVAKVAKDSNGVTFLLIRPDLFDRTVDAKGLKTEDSEEIVHAFLTVITKKRLKTFWVVKGMEFAGEFKQLCKTEGLRIYPTMSAIEAEFAERTIRSTKFINYPYMGYYGYKYIHKLSQFVTTLNSRTICLIDLIPKKSEEPNLLSILYSKPLQEYRNLKFKVGDRVHISQYELRKGYKSMFTEEVFENFAICPRKPPIYTMKDEQDENLTGKFYQN